MKLRRAVMGCIFSVSAAAYGADADQVFAREVKRGRDTFEFKYRVKLPALSNAAKLWIPTPKSDRFQRVKAAKLDWPGAKDIVETQHGNNIVFASLQPEQSGKVIEASYTVDRREKRPYPAVEDPVRYLKPERLVPTNATFA